MCNCGFGVDQYEVLIQCSLFDVEQDERNDPLVQTMFCYTLEAGVTQYRKLWNRVVDVTVVLQHQVPISQMVQKTVEASTLPAEVIDVCPKSLIRFGLITARTVCTKSPGGAEASIGRHVSLAAMGYAYCSGFGILYLFSSHHRWEICRGRVISCSRGCISTDLSFPVL